MEEEYAFRHSLLREDAHAMLTDRDRVIGHRLAGEWLEQAGEQDPKVLAEHFERGGEPARAAKYHLEAAELASEGYAIDEHEVGKIRENHWFPYFTYRLLAKHGADGKLVAQELTDLGIAFDRESLRDLVRSWRA